MLVKKEGGIRSIVLNSKLAPFSLYGKKTLGLVSEQSVAKIDRNAINAVQKSLLLSHETKSWAYLMPDPGFFLLQKHKGGASTCTLNLQE